MKRERATTVVDGGGYPGKDPPVGQTPDRHGRLRAVFDEALLQEPSTREAYVDRACASDPELKTEVMRLLAAHREARSFLEHPPDLSSAALRADAPFPAPIAFASCDGLARAAWAWSTRCTTRSATKSSP